MAGTGWRREPLPAQSFACDWKRPLRLREPCSLAPCASRVTRCRGRGVAVLGHGICEGSFIISLRIDWPSFTISPTACRRASASSQSGRNWPRIRKNARLTVVAGVGCVPLGCPVPRPRYMNQACTMVAASLAMVAAWPNHGGREPGPWWPRTYTMVAAGLYHGGREPVPWWPRAYTTVAADQVSGATPAVASPGGWLPPGAAQEYPPTLPGSLWLVGWVVPETTLCLAKPGGRLPRVPSRVPSAIPGGLW